MPRRRRAPKAAAGRRGGGGQGGPLTLPARAAERWHCPCAATSPRLPLFSGRGVPGPPPPKPNERVALPPRVARVGRTSAAGDRPGPMYQWLLGALGALLAAARRPAPPPAPSPRKRPPPRSASRPAASRPPGGLAPSPAPAAFRGGALRDPPTPPPGLACREREPAASVGRPRPEGSEARAGAALVAPLQRELGCGVVSCPGVPLAPAAPGCPPGPGPPPGRDGLP